MSVLKEIAAAMVGVYALMLGCDALFGAYDERFDDIYYRASFYAPRSSEFRFASDTPPAVRVDEVFAQFTYGETKSNKRYRL